MANEPYPSQAEENEINRNLFSALLQSTLDAIISIDQNQKIIFFNRGAESIFGYDSAEVVDQPIDLLLPTPYTAAHHAYIQSFAESPNTTWQMGRQHEIVGRRKDSTTFPAEVSITKTLTSEKKIFIVIVLRDITEHRRIEKQLSGSEKLFRQLAEAPFEIIIIHDNGTILEVNETACQEFGYQRSELIGKSCVDLVAPDSHELVRQMISTESRDPYECAAFHKDGTRFIAEIRGKPIDFQGRVVRVSALRDVTDHKRAEEQILRQNRHLNALHTIDSAIASSLDLNLTAHVIVEQTKTILVVDAVNLLLLNPRMNNLEPICGCGFRTAALQNGKIPIGEGFAGRIILDHERVYIPDIQKNIHDIVRAPKFLGEDIVTYIGMPLIAKGQIKGVLEVFHRSALDPNQEWFEFLGILAEHAAIAIDGAQSFDGLQRSNRELRQAYDTTIAGWSRALDLRDRETEGHSQRVTEWTIRLAREAGMSEDEIIHIRRGALLHDIGKLGIPDRILLKPGKLTEEEWVIMRKHPTYAFDMLSPISYLHPALDIPWCHHEKWDGSGYPRGLKGDQIPMAARLFAVVDVWDALRSDRPYRKRWGNEEIIEYIKSLAGTHFEPKSVDLFLKVLDDHREEPEFTSAKVSLQM